MFSLQTILLEMANEVEASEIILSEGHMESELMIKKWYLLMLLNPIKITQQSHPSNITTLVNLQLSK